MTNHQNVINPPTHGSVDEYSAPGLTGKAFDPGTRHYYEQFTPKQLIDFLLQRDEHIAELIQQMEAIGAGGVSSIQPAEEKDSISAAWAVIDELSGLPEIMDMPLADAIRAVVNDTAPSAWPVQQFAIVVDRMYEGEGPALAIWNGFNFQFSDGDCFNRDGDDTLDGYTAEWLTHHELEHRLFAAENRIQDEPEPDEALLVSMAMCLNHGFGLLDSRSQELMLHNMRKLWDEVIGRGYYNKDNRDRYLSMLTTSPAVGQVQQDADNVGGEGRPIETPEKAMDHAQAQQEAKQ